MKEKNTNKQSDTTQKITRKEAIQKGGKYAALTAAATLLILNPARSQTTSPAPPTIW